jgi:hypothetical protein
VSTGCGGEATAIENFRVFKPVAHQEEAVGVLLDQVIAWAAR